jgi:hypothetical protein
MGRGLAFPADRSVCLAPLAVTLAAWQVADKRAEFGHRLTLSVHDQALDACESVEDAGHRWRRNVIGFVKSGEAVRIAAQAGGEGGLEAGQGRLAGRVGFASKNLASPSHCP